MQRQPIPSFSEIVANVPKTTEYFDALAQADDMALELLETKASLEEARAQALTNPVSGLPNHLAFNNSLTERIAANDNIALAILDLTKFKTVNDTLGHLAGDSVLRSAGQIISDSLMLIGKTRHSDAVFHLGGDEYAILFDMTPRSDSSLDPEQRVAATQIRITTAIESYSTTDLPDGLDIAFAIGIARRQTGQTGENLFNMADTAMYQQKTEQHAKLGTVSR
jgi:diguanylate cyclase (GGDEF)-like protein